MKPRDKVITRETSRLFGFTKLATGFPTEIFSCFLKRKTKHAKSEHVKLHMSAISLRRVLTCTAALIRTCRTAHASNLTDTCTDMYRRAHNRNTSASGYTHTVNMTEHALSAKLWRLQCKSRSSFIFNSRGQGLDASSCSKSAWHLHKGLQLSPTPSVARQRCIRPVRTPFPQSLVRTAKLVRQEAAQQK